MATSNHSKKITIYDIVLIGLMAALCFVGTYLHIDIPTPLGKAMIHFGNIFCLLSGMLLGGVRGGLAAGIGSMLYDVLDPAYISECWITFINKFMMAFLCGIIVSYGVKRIAALHEKTENGSLAKKVSPTGKRVLLSLGVVVMAALAVFIGIQGGKVIAAFVNGSIESVSEGIIRMIGALVLIALMVLGIVFGVRGVLKPVRTQETGEKETQIVFLTRLFGGIAGILGYVVLYLSKNFIFGLIQRQEMETILATLITKGSISLINGVIAVGISMVLAPYFVMALQRSGLSRQTIVGKLK